MIKNISSNRLLLLSAVYFTITFNYPFLKAFMGAITQLDQYNSLFLISVPLLIVALLTILFSLFSAPFIFKPILITLTLSSSLVLYGAVNYGVVFDYGMIQNSVESSNAEAFSYLNVESILFFTVLGLFPSLFIAKIKIEYLSFFKELLTRLQLIALAFSVLLAIVFFFYQDYAAVGRNNSHLKKFITPTQFMYSGFKYIKHNYFDDEITFITLDQAPVDLNPTQKEVLVFVVGETARAQNFSINDYQKPTNAHTAPFNIVSFKKFSSCGTATAVSVPCMFSALDRDNFERRRADKQQNALDIIKLSGVDVLWIDNNGCKDVCNRINTITLDVNQDNPLCDGKYCQDEILLGPLAQKLKDLSHNKTIIVLHMMGSHGPTYYKRYPKNHRKFTPDCPRSDIQNCSHEALTNTYDNTIAYTDFVLSRVINQLNILPSTYKKSMIYISDHGESLGESGAYLHGLPYAFSPKEQRHIPMLYWSPDNNQFNECLKLSANNNEFSHDNIFHSLLGLLSINSRSYQAKKDVFAPCNKQPLTQLPLNQ